MHLELASIAGFQAFNENSLSAWTVFRVCNWQLSQLTYLLGAPTIPGRLISKAVQQTLLVYSTPRITGRSAQAILKRLAFPSSAVEVSILRMTRITPLW